MSYEPTNRYDTWIRALRQWRADPMVDMSQLPKLDASSFPPATYQRFVAHLNDAINRFMQRWEKQLNQGLETATSDHAVARALVNARVGLVERIKLAQHPSFPPEIREQLLNQAATDITSLQKQLEDAAVRSGRSAVASNRLSSEATLDLFRRNPLTAVLDPNYSVDGVINDVEMQRSQRAEADSLPDYPVAPSGDFLPVQPKRRVLINHEDGNL